MFNQKINHLVLLACFLCAGLFFTACNAENNATADADAAEKTQTEPAPKKAVSAMTLQEASEDMLRVLESGGDVSQHVQKFAAINPDTLAQIINTDAKKKAFYINLYNGYIQKILTENPELYKDRDKFFGEDRFMLAGKEISFDKLEHGIIRSSTMKLSGGFLSELFVGDYEKSLRTEKVDPRIHFAVNCGAKDCPPIHILSPTNIDAELDAMTQNYLDRWAEYDADKNVVKTTALMSWFRGDWGGKDGVKEFLQKYGIIPAGVETDDVDVEFKDYDWTLKTGIYADEV